VYLAVDYEARVIKLAEVRQNAVTPSPVRFPSAGTDCTRNKLSASTKVAIGLGLVVCLVLMIVTWIFYEKKRRNAIGNWFFHGKWRRNKNREQTAPISRENKPLTPQASQPGLEVVNFQRSQSTGFSPLNQEISAEGRIADFQRRQSIGFPPLNQEISAESRIADSQRSQSTHFPPPSQERSAEGRMGIYEMESPPANGGHPPPSPGAPGAVPNVRHASVTSQDTLPLHSNQRWNV
jgi:hypothetical protein